MRWWMNSDCGSLREKWYVGADLMVWFIFSSRCIIVSWEKRNILSSIYNNWKCCKVLNYLSLAPKHTISWPFGVEETMFFQKLFVVPAFSFVTDTAVWQMETNCAVQACWMAGSWGVSNSALKDDEARASAFCGRLRPDWSGHKVLVEETEKRRTGFRQAAVKLGELTMAALFLAGDMGWWGGVRWGDLSDSPETTRSAFLKWLQTEYLTSSQDLTWLHVERGKNKQQMPRFYLHVLTLDAVW